MFEYKDFSSLEEALGFSGKTLYSVSNHISKHYRAISIPKKNGELRQLYVPDALLKAIQRKINNELLQQEEISPYATAYRSGGSTRLNAGAHVGHPVLVKLDVKHFFDHLIYPVVKDKAFPFERYSEQNRVLLSLLCVFHDALPQGAPTSPTISNIIMRDFDNTVGAWCTENNISYTRYCDDMTFSGDFDPTPLIKLVRSELRKIGLFLNNKKTVILDKGQKHSVTGVVVNEKMSVSADYKKKIRQEMYYCMKFGMASHLASIGSGMSEREYVLKLLGRINYVLSIEQENAEMKLYQNWIKKHGMDKI